MKALIARGVTDRRPLDSLKGGSGYSSVGTDLSTLASVLRAHPDEVAATTMKLVDEAQKLSAGIIWEAPKRGSESTAVNAASDDRQRAYTLFAHAYDEARRAVSFLRWHEGDADTLVPSLYAGRGGRGAKSSNEPEKPAPDGTNANAPTDVSPTPAPAIAPGMPNSSPFADS